MLSNYTASHSLSAKSSSQINSFTNFEHLNQMNEVFTEAVATPVLLAGAHPSLVTEGGFSGWEGIKASLTEFAQLPNAYQLLESAFDIKEHQAARAILNEWKGGVFNNLPTISVLTDVEMQGAFGGYSAELCTIFLSSSVVKHDPITGLVILEELGHHLDSLFNLGIDTPGDEGELFSAIVAKANLTEEDISRMKKENDDWEIVFSSGKKNKVEASTTLTTHPSSIYRIERLDSDGPEGRRHSFAIIRTGNVSAAGRVLVTASSDTAISGHDFRAYSRVSFFSPGQTSDVIFIDSLPDKARETTERFRIALSKVESNDSITSGSAFGEINDVSNEPFITLKRLYREIHNRDSDSDELLFWHHQLAAGITLSQVRTAFANSQEATNNLTQLYRAIHNRVPDSGGLQFWRDKLITGMKLSQVRTAFANSKEATNNLTQIYRDVHNRVPDPGELQFWQDKLATGMTLHQVRSGFAISQEATNNLKQIYRDVHNRIPDSGELQFWQDKLATGMTLSQVRNAFANSQEATNNLTQLYRDIHSRDPDSGGLEFWRDKLVTGMTLPQIRSGFAISQEATNNLTQIYRDFDNRVPDSGELQFWQDRLATGMTLSQVSASFQSASKYSIDRLNSDGNEGHRHTFKIFRTGNTSIAGQVKFATSNDSATSDVDFSSYSAVRNFAPGQTEDVVYVDSRTDSINEGTERFNVSISKVNNADTITTASTFGQIFNLNAPSGYISQLNSWSDAQWNWAAGDETRITGPYWPGSRDERNYQDQSSVLQVYNDLSNMILGRTFSSSAGYVLDPGYWDDPNAGKLYGWHHGIDIDTPNNTITKVKALVGGTLSLVQNIKGNYFLQVNGDDGRFYQYGHLSSFVKASGRISAGEIIGEVGMSAASNHLHFQVNRTSTRPPGYDKYDQDSVYSWTLNPLKVFWQLRREGKV